MSNLSMIIWIGVFQDELDLCPNVQGNDPLFDFVNGKIGVLLTLTIPQSKDCEKWELYGYSICVFRLVLYHSIHSYIFYNFVSCFMKREEKTIYLIYSELANSSLLI